MPAQSLRNEAVVEHLQIARQDVLKANMVSTGSAARNLDAAFKNAFEYIEVLRGQAIQAGYAILAIKNEYAKLSQTALLFEAGQRFEALMDVCEAQSSRGNPK